MSAADRTDGDGQITTTITATTHLTLPSHPTPLTYAQLNPTSLPHEFLGVAGTTALCFVTPFFAYFLFYACNETTGCPPTSRAQWAALLDLLGAWPSSAGKLWDWKAAGVYMGWYAYTVLCWAVLPGQKVEGGVLRDGTRRVYTMNGFATFLLTMGLLTGLLLQPGGIERLSWVYDHFVPLLSASVAMSLAQAGWVYAHSFFSRELLALGGNSGRFFYDFWMGRPLNPTFPGFPSFDIKTFNEVRPGIIGWVVLNVACACEQYLRQGRVSDSMWLVIAFEGYYAADCLYSEASPSPLFYIPLRGMLMADQASILGQMDITTDGFGFMLSFGDLTWLPFTYGLQARYLAFHPVHLGYLWSGAIVALELTGLYVFRTANNEKYDFRMGRNPKNLQFIETRRGTKLLTSGWWGRSRHPNYFGDWLMALAWCLPVGLTSPMPYYYIVFFVVLLVHRQRRDDEACKEKYGTDWARYCGLVPWRIIPWMY